MVKQHKAFTLIELIFAIVIIGITVLSLPMISQTTGKATEKNLAQEAIVLASSELKKVISGKWDEHSKNSDAEDKEVIVYTSDAEVNTAINNQRTGNIRILYENNTTLRPSVSGLDSGEITINDADDIDDYKTNNTVVVSAAGSAAGYKDLYKKTITIDANQSFGTLNNDPNIKKITIEIKNSHGELLTKLYTYSMNIGNASSLFRTLK